MRKLLFTLAGVVVVLNAAVFAGPFSSGGIFLLLPTFSRPTTHELPASYEPLHKGYVELNIGHYVRENEDLVVPGSPPLVLRRTHYSNWLVDKEFGLGTTQAAEWYIRGDGQEFKWASVVRPGTSQVRFTRTSAGASWWNAMYQHRGSDADWHDARLGWTGFDWALRHLDGTRARFRPCGPAKGSVCSISEFRDADGHVINYRRNGAGRLERIEAPGNRWIAFDYDDRSHVVRAHDSTKHEVRYEYDGPGRLVRVIDGNVTRRYTYTDRGEMATIVEPDVDIQNFFDDNGRCIKQVNRHADGSPPYVLDFSYGLDGEHVAHSESRHSDGTWYEYSFNTAGFTTSESWGGRGYSTATFVLERDPDSNDAVAVSLTCLDRTGRELRHSSRIEPGQEKHVKWDLARTHCSWSGPAKRSAE